MYLGDIPSQQNLDFCFTSVNSSGVPTTLSGSPAISVYKGNSTTQTTVGVTLDVDHDSVTGLNHVRIATTDVFYATGSDFHVIITAGTVGGSSVVGYRVAEFSIENRDIRANVVQISGDATAADNLEAAYDGTGYTDGTAQAGSGTTITLASGASSVDDYYKGALIAPIGGTGGGQGARLCTGYVGSTKVATVTPAWATNPDSTTTYAVIPWGAVGALANEAIDSIFKRDMSSITGEASRSMLNALRFLRNKFSISGSTLTVCKEDDSSVAFTSALTGTAGADPITGSDPT